MGGAKVGSRIGAVVGTCMSAVVRAGVNVVVRADQGPQPAHASPASRTDKTNLAVYAGSWTWTCPTMSLADSSAVDDLFFAVLLTNFIIISISVRAYVECCRTRRCQ